MPSNISLRIARAAAARLGFTPDQEAAYLRAIEASPPSLPGPRGTMKPVDTHAIGLEAARAAGYVGTGRPVSS